MPLWDVYITEQNTLAWSKSVVSTLSTIYRQSSIHLSEALLGVTNYKALICAPLIMVFWKPQILSGIWAVGLNQTQNLYIYPN